MKYLSFFSAALLLLLVSSCDGSGSPAAAVNEDPAKPKKNESFQQRAKREIKAKLDMNATEKFAMRTYWSYINDDTIKDAIITVNRMEFAMDEAIKANKTAKAEEMGYLGNYNFFFFYDGAIDLISDPIAVPSSPGRELDVTFQSVTSPSKKDVIIDYRIRNSGWRSYFTSSGQGALSLMFQWKWFDHIGEAQPEALMHALEPSPESPSMQDISIYESAIENNPPDMKKIYEYEPVMTRKEALLYRFFFDPRVGKYRLYSKKMLSEMGLTAIGDGVR
jgi:hypothetical protein